MTQLWFTFLFGIFLGFKHALDADHLTAVATMIAEHKNSFRAALVGTFWGIGHTTTLFMVGLAVLLLKINIPAAVQLFLELGVGIMLVGLGLSVLFKKNLLHAHQHRHNGLTHNHIHTDHSHEHRHKRSFVIGAVHGLAGSGTLMVLILSTFQSAVAGVVYILLFGVGSIIGMTAMSFLLGLPFHLAKNKLAQFNRLEFGLQKAAGIFSLTLGLWIIYEIGFTNVLFINY